MQAFEPGADNTRLLRDAFGRFGTGVTVVTIRTEDGPLGMTANSFSSISLDPALVMWAPGRSSLRHDAFVEAEAFCVHVLAADQLPLAQHFASQGHDFAEFDWDRGTASVPTFSGCLATFHCTTHAVHAAGDHSLVLGAVTHAALRKGEVQPLLFSQGAFGQFSPMGGHDAP